MIVDRIEASAAAKEWIFLGHFCRYDFKPLQNMKTYGKTLPPTYNLKMVSAPVAIYYATNDIMVAAKVFGCFIRRGS